MRKWTENEEMDCFFLIHSEFYFGIFHNSFLVVCETYCQDTTPDSQDTGAKMKATRYVFTALSADLKHKVLVGTLR